MARKNFPVRIPRFAAGIRAQESRFGAGSGWWAREWMRRLEGMGLKGRLGRGKNYAVSGQVTALRIAGNRIEAEVVGTRAEPYRVAIDFRLPDGATRARLAAAIRAEPVLVARLLADDLPAEVGQIFRNEGFDLFPGGKLGPGKYDVTTSCSCPDYANPCKHAAAVLLLLAGEIARRPLTLLEFRGVQPEDLADED